MTKRKAPRAEPRWQEPMRIDVLHGNPDNAKTHNIDSMAESFETVGYIEPVIIDERTGFLVGGHGRVETLLAMRDNGEDRPDGVEVDGNGDWLVDVFRGWASRDDVEAEAAMMALNRYRESGGWMNERLVGQLESIDDLRGSGFGPDDIVALKASIKAEHVQFSRGENSQGGTETAHNDRSYDERAERYRGKQIRSVVMDFPLDDHKALRELAARVRPGHPDARTDADLFLALLREWDAAHPEAGAA